MMGKQISIRQFVESDANEVSALFIKVSRLLAPAALKEAFEVYIRRSQDEEIDRILAYYGVRGGGFWVATIEASIVGMFGLEPSGEHAMELRRMYVNPDWRRRGIAGKMLTFAEDYCRANDALHLDLSTSELQSEALSFYRQSGYAPVREEVAEAANNKTIGGGVRRYHFKKILSGRSE